MNVGTGEVLYDRKRSREATDVLASVELIDLHTPKDLEIHVVPEDLSARAAPPVAI